MSLATNIKEFADVLHNIYAQQLSYFQSADLVSDGVLPLAIPKLVVLQQLCLYAAKSFTSGIFYFLSFQWLRDFSYFPLISTESQSNHDTFLSEPFSYLFSFAKNGVSLSLTPFSESQGATITPGKAYVDGFFKSDCLVSGFVNSFFFSLPFSLPHLITLRRMFSQGAAAAAASILGTITAHSLVLIGVIYGIRFLIIPYYSLQPLTFCFGLITIGVIITEFVKEKRVYLVPITHYPSLIRIGILSFIVALCESATVFHDLHHLTLNSQISYLQLYDSQNLLDSFLNHTTYVIAFVLGHALFSLLFTYLILKGVEKACSLTGWTLPQTARRISKALLIAILTLTFSCFPYYGLDYLFTKSAGFLPEDPAYRNTIFSPTQVRSRNRHFKSRAPATKNSKTPLELDLNYFDRGMYLNAPKEEKISNDLDTTESGASSEMASTYDPALTFEELNYQGESAWLMRHERARRLPEEQDSKKESIFQKPKTHFKSLREKQESKQAEAALKETSQIGAISEWNEGSRPGERLSFYNGKPKTFLSTSSGGDAKDHTLHIAEKTPSYKSKICTTQSEALHVYEGDVISSPLINTKGHTQYSQPQDKRLLLKELAFEKEIASAYEKSFTSPFGEESDGTPPELLPVENIIKKRYRLNPVYRALLQTDIDLFIARQPEDYKITQNQEASLFKKRGLLEKYYNSIRYYSPVESVGFAKKERSRSSSLGERELQYVPFQEGMDWERGNASTTKALTKSFVESLYHQQFKGTLSTVKRFFKLTFDDGLSLSKNRILSYDQPLYKKNSASSFYKTHQNVKAKDLQNNTKHKMQENYHPSLHEELSLEEAESKGNPFIEESNCAPIYAGWDDKTRRFVITNRFNLIE